ncbi:MAG: glycosyltransferase family 4 protein [Muribaculaceae bacterium]|nr:glycosyltransferase family 4 protein [Muribaculaceae bacterium]
MTTIAVIGIRGLPGIQGGVEKHCENIYPCMGNDIKFNIYRRKSYITPFSNVQFPNISFIDLPSTRIKGFEAVFHTFISCLHILFHRPDIVHIHNIGPGMFTPLLRLFGIRVILTYHSPNYEHKKWGTIAKAILRMSEFLSLNFATRIIFVNKFQMEKYPQKIKLKSEYIPNGINDIEISTNTNYIDRLGAEKGKYVLGVGRITPEKGFEYLIEAINRIDAVPQLVIAGASDHDTAYLDYLKSLDTNHKVIFSGFTTGDDLAQLYSNARMFVLSSVNEGFPLVMLEAMSYSLPMVVSDIPATHLIELPKEYYANKADSNDLAAKINATYNNAESKVKYNLEQYRWKDIALHTSDIYREISK